MNEKHWKRLIEIMEGKVLDPLPAGFIIDSPWLANWAGGTFLDYFVRDEFWFEANRKAAETFPEAIFLPGFWVEYGMCTEPSAFGSRCIFPENEFPFPEKMMTDIAQVDAMKKPNCKSDGFAPFVINRMDLHQEAMEKMDCRHRFACSRGPLNVATYLLGHTELLMAMKLDPKRVHALLRIVTDFIVDWIAHQSDSFPTIDGMLILDDIIGFVGGEDFDEFVVPYFQEIATSQSFRVKALHNDCHGLITAEKMTVMGYNLFNFSFEHSLLEIRDLAGPDVVLLGNLPPRDCLAAGEPEEVKEETRKMRDSIGDPRRVLFSVGGGVPPNVPTENFQAFFEGLRS
jgi:uroporphyrinogen decarboxylase